VIHNLLGSFEFAPMVRKTALLKEYEKKELGRAARETAQQYDPSVLARAPLFVYNFKKELDLISIFQ
jgi:hypothetical protein